ncbi:MAG: lysophospholipid acyltransferase family protein [Proteobacteria bacterium]|nr:lysophospholipid acyltransferase family protein [Pseudomonadota bacterium]
MRRRIKNTLIYYLTRFAVILFGLVPARFVTRTGQLIGALAHFVAGDERRLARHHLSMAFGLTGSERRVHLLARGVFCELGVSAIELCRLSHSLNKHPRVVIPKESRRALDRALAEEKGVIFVTGHLGNWELMAITLASLGYPISTIAKESYDSRFTKLIDRFRRDAGVQAIYRGQPGASATMLRALKENRVLGFLIDQDTSVPSMFVPFFGRPAYTPTGAAVLAVRKGIPIVVGTIHRTADGGHVVEIAPCPVRQDVKETTAELTHQLETRIRSHPSQWIWFHKRWKTRPAEKEVA